MKKLLCLMVAIGLTGCGVKPVKQSYYTQMDKREVYALVRDVVPATESTYCKNIVDPQCAQIRDFDVISSTFARNWNGPIFGYLLVPKSEHIAEGDIVKYRVGNQFQNVANEFVKIAAREAESEAKSCGWVGGKIMARGGVECEGWSYKDQPVQGGDFFPF